MSGASLSPFSPSSSCSSPSQASPSTRTIVLSEDLPLPTVPKPFSTKKSHARKQPLGHIPRPRNAFILFRCDYSRQKKKKTKDHDQNVISRMVADVWRNMTDAQKEPWVVIADAEKKRHEAMYPGYRYSPRVRRPRNPVEVEIQQEADRVVKAEREETKETVTIYYPPWTIRRTAPHPGRRASSCPPPGAVEVDSYSETFERFKVEPSIVPAAVAERVERPADSPSMNINIASSYGIHDVNASPEKVETSCQIIADQQLANGMHRIDPPGRTCGWGAEPSSPMEYTEATGTGPGFQGIFDNFPHLPHPSFSSTDPFKERGMLPYGESYRWHEGPAMYSPESDYSSLSSPSSPITPMHCSAGIRSPSSLEMQYEPETMSFGESEKEFTPPRPPPILNSDFRSEFGNIVPALPSVGYKVGTGNIARVAGETIPCRPHRTRPRIITSSYQPSTTE